MRHRHGVFHESQRVSRRIPPYFSQGTGHVIEAMKAHGVRRLVVLSAFGRAKKPKGRQLPSGQTRHLAAPPRAIRRHERQEKLVRESGLDGSLHVRSDSPAGTGRGRYARAPQWMALPRPFSRDLADFLVAAAEPTKWSTTPCQLGR